MDQRYICQKWPALLASIWTMAIVIASLLPMTASDEGLWWVHTDKIVHFTFYFGATVLWLRAGYRQRGIGYSLILLGWTIEYLQQLSGWRSGDVYDGLFNTFGVVSAWIVAKIALASKH